MIRAQSVAVRLWGAVLVGIIMAGTTTTSALAQKAGTLQGALSTVSTGSRPFDDASEPGKDAGPDDEVVRSNDTITYRVDASARGSVDNTTITIKLDGDASWTSLPSACKGDGSQIDGPTLTCNLGTLANHTTGVQFVAKVDGGAPNASTIKASAEVSGDDTDSQTPDPISTTVSAAPNWDVSKKGARPIIRAATRNGEAGSYVTFPMSILHRGADTRGVEALQSDISFSDDVSKFYATAAAGAGDWEFVGCSGNGEGPPVFSSLPSAHDMSKVNLSCAHNGGKIDVKLSGLDTSMTNVPSTSYSGAPLPADTKYAFAGKLVFWVPSDDIEEFGELKQGLHSLRTADTLTDFQPTSVSGQPNSGDDPDNNSAEASLTDATAGSFTKLYGSAMRNGNAGMVAPNAEQPLDRRGVVTPGDKFTSQVVSNNSGQTAFDATGRVCDVFDNKVQQVTGKTAALFSNRNGGGQKIPGAKLEWGVGKTPAGPRADCGDDDAAWFDNPDDAPGGKPDIDRVRWIITDPQPAGTYYRFITELQAKPGHPTDSPVRDWGRVQWPNFDDGAVQAPAADDVNATGGMADRMKLVAALSRVTVKTAELDDDAEDPSDSVDVAEAGEPVRFVLEPTLTDGTGETGRECPVTVTYTVPQGLEPTDPSKSVPVTSVTNNPDGSTTLTWDLGKRKINEPLPPIDVLTQEDPTLPNGRDLPTTAVVTTSCDTSPKEDRTAKRTVTVSAASAYRVFEDIGPEVNVIGDEVGFRLNEVNASSRDVPTADLITVLPANEDKVDSEITGPVQLKRVKPAAGGTVYYTSATSADIELDPNAASNQPNGANKWCTEQELGTAGCPASLEEATGVRVKYDSELTAGATRVTSFVVDAPDSKHDEVIGGQFGARAGGLRLPVFSNQVQARFIAGSIGDHVWYDEDKDGIQDDGEKPASDVTVKLTGTSDAPKTRAEEAVSQTTTTDANGKYAFTGLRPGEYVVRFESPDGYTFTKRFSGPGRTDSNANGDGESDSHDLRRITGGGGNLSAVTDDKTVDAGLIKTDDDGDGPPSSPDRPQGAPGQPSGPGQNPLSGSGLPITGQPATVLLAGVGGVIAALIGGLVLYRTRRRDNS